jgi:peroxiredoxin
MNHRHAFERAAALTAVLLALTAGSAGATGQVGDIAAGFTLQSTSGQTHSLSDHDGKVKFLFMFGHG